MRSLPEIKAANALLVDRNVVVHLRARQADIYEKALRKIADDFLVWELEINDFYAIAQKALKRAEKIR